MGAGGRDRVNPFCPGFNCPLSGVGSCAAPIAPEAFLRLTPAGRGSEQKKHNKSKAAAGKKPRWEKSEKQETASPTLMGMCNLGPGGRTPAQDPGPGRGALQLGGATINPQAALGVLVLGVSEASFSHDLTRKG